MMNDCLISDLDIFLSIIFVPSILNNLPTVLQALKYYTASNDFEHDFPILSFIKRYLYIHIEIDYSNKFIILVYNSLMNPCQAISDKLYPDFDKISKDGRNICKHDQINQTQYSKLILIEHG